VSDLCALFCDCKIIFKRSTLFKEKNPSLETKFKKSKEKDSESYQETDETDEHTKVFYRTA
jgi:hypothetical protein